MSKVNYTVKGHFYAHAKFKPISQNGPLDKFIQFLFIGASIFMYCNVA